MRILKYPLNPESVPTILSGKLVNIVDIQIQSGIPTAWILTSEDAIETTVRIQPIGTGWNVPEEVFESMSYVRTVQDPNGYVWHYFYGIEDDE